MDDLQQETFWAALEKNLRSWEKEFFKGIRPISELRIVDGSVDYPAGKTHL